MPSEDPSHEHLVREGREAYRRRAWGAAYEALSSADSHGHLAADDLERLAFAAYLTGHEDAALAALELAHRAHLADGELARGARCAFWLGMLLLQGGQPAQGGGWLRRAETTLAAAEGAELERAYLRVPLARKALDDGDPATASAVFEQVARTADQADDPDLVALSRLGQGQARIDLGDAEGGIAMLDEAMVTVTSGTTSPLVAGIVYCAVIIACQEAFDLGRAQEWTRALTRWCDEQPDLQPFRGQCLVHRSEVLTLQGAWPDALREVEAACRHLAQRTGDPAVGMAHYQRAELCRLRGAFDEAEAAYQEASRWGHPLQPGLALLRLAQGRIADAEAAIRRVVEEDHPPARRCRVLAACGEIMLAVGDLAAARAAVDDITAIARSAASRYLEATAASLRGTVQLAEGDPTAACASLQTAVASWQELEVPHDLARTKLALVRALRELGDRDTAEVELATARRLLERLGATPALEQARALSRRGTPVWPAGLTEREVEVLTLIAAGRTNQQIADELVISSKTVARHVSNIYRKLGIGSRAAATAYAYQHDIAAASGR